MVELDPLPGARVLVTGADGFIGSHLVERLVAGGATVRAFCMYNSQGSWGWLDESPPEVRDSLDVRLGDIRDAGFVEESCRDIDIVFHLAALIAIPYSYVAPESFVATNVQGTLNVLQGARHADVRRIVHTSTSEVYGTPESLPIRESHPLNAQSPYAATKIAADQLASAFERSFGTPVVILRPFNTYGPRQSSRAVIVTIIEQLLAGRRELRLGRLDPMRDFTFVSDTVEGFVRAGLARGIDGRVIQLGTGRTETIADVLAVAARHLGVEAVAIEDPSRVRPPKSEVMVLQSDPTLAADLLDWRAQIALEDGIGRTVDWARSRAVRRDVERVQL
jgi:UDP-glucose 4-epimerase